MPQNSKPFVRRLYGWEIEEARRVFGNSMQFGNIRIHECSSWTNYFNQLTTWLRHLQRPLEDNAITLGNHCYFPVRLPDRLLHANQPDFYKLPWLMHELTHVWQYQRMGWSYFFRAVSAQLRNGSRAYKYGGAESLDQIYRQGFLLRDFNLEQQGEIIRDYYWRLMGGQDIRAFQPFIDQLQQDI